MRILMVMHVDWRWVKQRPHFLAEEAVRRRHEVLVLFKPHPDRLRLPRNRSTVRRRSLLPLPHSARHGRLVRTTRRLQRLHLRRYLIRFRPDVVVVTHPLLWNVLPRRARRSLVVYDCMDDALAMARPSDVDDVEGSERSLVESSDVITASSAYLARLLERRFDIADALLVRNGLSADLLEEASRPMKDMAPSPAEAPQLPLLTYVGTVAHWLDFEALERLRDAHLGDIRLVGPKPRAGLTPDGIALHGPVEHAHVMRILMESDALLLPFKPSALVNAVDPVKLYEYVASQRPIVARYFAELEHFRPFVTFYHSPDGIVDAVRKALGSPIDPEAREGFVQANTWTHRWRLLETELASRIDRVVEP